MFIQQHAVLQSASRSKSNTTTSYAPTHTKVKCMEQRHCHIYCSSSYHTHNFILSIHILHLIPSSFSSSSSSVHDIRSCAKVQMKLWSACSHRHKKMVSQNQENRQNKIKIYAHRRYFLHFSFLAQCNLSFFSFS